MDNFLDMITTLKEENSINNKIENYKENINYKDKLIAIIYIITYTDWLLYLKLHNL